MGKKDVTMDTAELRGIIRDYCRQLPIHWKCRKNRFLPLCNPPRLSQDDIEQLNEDITEMEFESVIKTTKKCQDRITSPKR